MRVAVVGAGLAGLAAARELRADGHEVVVLEKSRGLGGRLATRRAEGMVLDHGGPVLAAPEGSASAAWPTPSTPTTAWIWTTASPSRPALVRSLAYAPAVMVLVGVAGGCEGPAVERPAEGPVSEVRREAAKRREADPAPVVARLRPEASAELLDASDAAVLEQALPALLGAEPAWSRVKRWRFAVPEGRLDPDEVNPPDARIVVAGDTVTGASFGGDDHRRVFASGVDAARRLTHALAVAAP